MSLLRSEELTSGIGLRRPFESVVRFTDQFRVATVTAGAAVTAAILYTIAVPPRSFAWIGLICLVPWLCVLRRSSTRSAAIAGLLFGLVHGWLMVAWMPGALNRFGLPTENALLFQGISVAWLTGVPWAVFAMLAARTGRQETLIRASILGGLLLAIDTVRSHWILQIPWGLLGHSQAEVPGIAQLAAVAGVPLLSAVVVAVNVGVADGIARWKAAGRAGSLRVAGASVGALLTLGTFGLSVAQRIHAMSSDPEAPPFEALLVQPNLPPKERWSPLVQRTSLAILTRDTQAALRTLKRPPQLIVWPEAVVTTPLDQDPVLRGELLEAVDDLGIPVILGAMREAAHEERLRSAVFWVEPGSGIVRIQDKTRAIPFLESARAFPGYPVVKRLMGIDSARPRIEEGVEAGPLRRGPVELAAVLCYEALFPGEVARRTTPRTAALVNPTNDSWFGDLAPSAQQVAFTSFRAIEQRLWVLRAAHNAGSAIIDPWGRVSRRLGEGRGHLVARVTPVGPPTFPERLAIVALAVSGAALGFLLTSLILRRMHS